LPLVVAGFGAVLVASSPVWPSDRVSVVVRVLDGEAGEEVGDLVAGQRDLPGGGRGVEGFEGGSDGEDGGGEHGEGDPPVPGGPAADLVLVQAGDALAGLEVFLGGRPVSSTGTPKI
jgi:hypothetical protein